MEFGNNLVANILAGIILAVLLGGASLVFRRYIRRYIRHLFRMEIELNLTFYNGGGVIEMRPNAIGKYPGTYVRFKLKNSSDSAVDLDHSYLHLIVDRTTNLIVTPMDSKSENGMVHFQIPLKSVIPRGSFSLESYLQQPATEFFWTVGADSSPRDMEIYYFFQTSTTYYPERVTFNTDDSVQVGTCG